MFGGKGHHDLLGLIVLHFLVDCVSGLDTGQRTGLIIGCSIGGAILLIVVIVLLVCCCKPAKDDKRLKKKKAHYRQFLDPNLPTTHLSQHHPDAHYKAANGHANGHVQQKSVPKLERSLSDVQARTGYMPDWRNSHDRVENGSQLSGFADNRSDISAGIWTSNPTLTRGLYPSHVVGTNGRDVSNGHPKQVHASGQTFGQDVGSLEKGHKAPSKGGGVKANKKERTKGTDDKKKLIPSKGKDNPNQNNVDPKTFVKVYSNPNVSVAEPPSQQGPFVAKVYSDYQRPRNLSPDNHPPSKPRSKVVKAYSAYTKENVDHHQRVVSSQPQPIQGEGHVARAVVRHNSSYISRSNGERNAPYNDHQLTQSDWLLHKASNRPVTRTQSNLERTRPIEMIPVSKQRQSLAGQVANRESARPNQASAVRTQAAPGKYDKGVHNQYTSAGQDYVHRAQNTNAQSQVLSGPSKNAKQRKKDKKGPSQSNGHQNRHSKSNVPANNNKASVVDRNPSEFGNEEIDIHIMPASYTLQSDTPVILNSPTDRDLETSPRRISESSSIPREPDPLPSSSLDSPDKTTTTDIYAVPQKRESRPVSDVVVVTVDTPVSPDPPAVPPVTTLRQEPLTPSTPSRRRVHSSSASDGDGLSTGKRVIGDAFQFLDDFDDNTSFDGDPEVF